MGLGAFACGIRGAKKAFGAFGGFDGWQTAGLNANMGLGAFACGVGGAKKAFGAFGAFGGFGGWQTAGLNVNKKRLIIIIWALVPLPAGLGVPKRPWLALLPWTKIYNAIDMGLGWHCCREKLFDIWALVPLPAGLGVPKRRLEGVERLEGLTAGKWQA